MKYKTISIVIPCYNEEQFIESVLEAVMKSDTSGLKKEIVVVNDGSTDNTSPILHKLVKKYADVILIDNKENHGKGHALKEGLMKTTGDIVLIQDSDAEYNPRDYPILLEPFLEYEADVVYGSRLVTSLPHRVLFFWHYKVNQFLTLVSNIFTGLNLTDMETGFKLFKGEIIRTIAPRLESKRFGFEPEITARVAKLKNVKIFEVGISYSGRTYSQGKKIGWKDGLLALWEIVKFNLFV